MAIFHPEQRERRAYHHAYAAAHREEKRASGRAYAAAHREEKHAYDRAYRAAHPDRLAASNRRRLYGPDADFEALMAAQNGMCAGGCDRPPTDLDHDHETGAVRGALCNPCNMTDVLGRNSRTDPDLTPEEMDQLHDLVGAALEAGSPRLATSRAWEARRKTRDAAIKETRLAEIDAQAAAMGWL